MKTVAVVQARIGSTRLPGKVLRPICGRPALALLLERLSGARLVDRIVLAIPTGAADDPLDFLGREEGYDVYRGSHCDVLERYRHAAIAAGADVVVRITGDCPLIDPGVVDEVIRRYVDGDADYVSNTIPPTYPDGLDTEVFGIDALERAWKEARDPRHREHVTLYFKESGAFSLENVGNRVDHSDERWTLDEPDDLTVIGRIFEHFHPRTDFSWREILSLRARRPAWFADNRHLIRDEGSRMNEGQKLWRRAKSLIPGGSMLLSKRAEMFLPDQWPTYYSRAKGCTVWDLEGRSYEDVCLMGIGTNTLGYGREEVDAAAAAAIDRGNLSTLNCPEEVRLAERLVELHPWSDMVRFARTGGEANAIAVRVARAAAGREKVAFCGYHGWHDWYLAANLGDETNLEGHLLPGLAPRGVPTALRGTVLPFTYNRLDELKALLDAHEIGVIKMEVSRNFEPEPGFLEGARRLADESGAVLIFDECSSGFRQTFGGLHKLFGVEPDLAVFGKTLANGYAMTAVIGRRSVMDAAQDSFISSTFWTERIGPSAALATLDVMETERSWERITETGRSVRDRWLELGRRHGLPVTVSGLPSMSSFSFESNDMPAYRTLITQEMLKAGFLATNTLYAALPHTEDVIDRYVEALDPIFATIRECEDGRPVADLLEGPVVHAGFRRLN